MASSLFRESSAALKQQLAIQMGCREQDYHSNTLTIVERPQSSREPHLALVTTCGTGSVLSVRDGRLGDWAASQSLEAHYRIFLPSFLEGLAARARELGHADAKSHSASTGLVLAEDLAVPPLPDGYTLRELPAGDQATLRASGTFDNALGEPDDLRKIAAMRVAVAAVDPHGAVAAVSGVWDQYPGFDEIGVDVAREHRGRGLARALTLYAVGWVRGEGRWPIYTCGFTNVRSLNNGLSCGFRPLWQLSAVYVPADLG